MNVALERCLPAAETHPERFHAALRYAVLGGGKRLRPLLTYAAGEWLGLAAERLDAIAVAVELTHAYSLVHDDLPALDNDDLRRGRPTTHVAFDEATAILVGDALQAHAYHALATDAALDATASMRRLLVLDLARASGSAGMAGGQALDMRPETDGVMATDAVEALYRMKTGCLLEAAACMTLRLLPPADPRAARLRAFARAFGLGFQVADDLLDIECPADVTGKPQGSDERNGKRTLPSLVGIPAARARLDGLRNDALAAFDGSDAGAEGLRWIAGQALAGRFG